jgi:hypothetical protein
MRVLGIGVILDDVGGEETILIKKGQQIQSLLSFR